MCSRMSVRKYRDGIRRQIVATPSPFRSTLPGTSEQLVAYNGAGSYYPTVCFIGIRL
jgi:hypothetical protein